MTGSWRQNSAKGKRLDSELLRHRVVCAIEFGGSTLGKGFI